MASEAGRHRWLIYALGGGMGHLTRAISLARAIRRRFRNASSRHSVFILTNTPFASELPIESEIGPGDRVLRISPSGDRQSVTSEVQQILGREKVDTLVVDTFPRGIAGELAETLPKLRCRKVLVHRVLCRRYVDRFSIVPFARHFDHILVPGESAALDSLPNAIRTGPWLIRNSDELLESSRAIEMMRVGGHQSVVAVLGCGKDEEAVKMRQVASKLATRFQDRAAICFFTPGRLASPLASGELASGESVSGELVIERRLWPFFQVIRGASVVVGGGGYNTVQESRAAGKPLLAFAWPRLYDRQSDRLSNNERIASTSELIARVEELLRTGNEAEPDRAIDFRNGVDDAVAALES